VGYIQFGSDDLDGAFKDMPSRFAEMMREIDQSRMVWISWLNNSSGIHSSVKLFLVERQDRYQVTPYDTDFEKQFGNAIMRMLGFSR